MYFDNVSNSPDVLFLGDSHMAYSIKNKYLNTSDVSLHTIDAINNDSSYRNVLFDFRYKIEKGR